MLCRWGLSLPLHSTGKIFHTDYRRADLSNVRIGDKKKSSASLLEIEIRFIVSSHINITRRCQRVWLHIVQTTCYTTAYQVRHKGTCTYVSRTKNYTLQTETSRAKCYNPALGVTRAMSYPKEGVTTSQQELQFEFPRILAMATVWGFPRATSFPRFLKTHQVLVFF